MLECSFVNYNNNAPLIDDVIKFMQFHGFMMFDVTGPTMGGHLMNSRKIQCDVIFINKIKKEWLVLLELRLYSTYHTGPDSTTEP